MSEALGGLDPVSDGHARLDVDYLVVVTEERDDCWRGCGTRAGSRLRRCVGLGVRMADVGNSPVHEMSPVGRWEAVS